MTEKSPLAEAQQQFIDTLPFRSMEAEQRKLSEASGCTLHDDILAPTDMPAYHRAIVEGFIVNTADTQGADETSPKSFSIVGEVNPGDTACPHFGSGQAIRVATGSIVPDGPFAIVRLWEATVEGENFTITRPFPPRFFIEEKGGDFKQGNVVVPAGTVLMPQDIGNIASLGIDQVSVSRPPRVTIFSSGDEVIPYTDECPPGSIRDSNSVMLAAAVSQAGGIANIAGIMKDDFDSFVNAAAEALILSDMIVISGGTAIGGRDFISDLLRKFGKLVIDGVPMRSGRPLIMGVAGEKPVVCVAGHPPEALRGFNLFGVAAINKILGRDTALPEDQQTGKPA